MDPLLHTLIAVGCLAVSFYCGKYLSINSDHVEELISGVLERLEREGFIVTKTDDEGEKELIPVSELIAKAVREVKK